MNYHFDFLERMETIFICIGREREKLNGVHNRLTNIYLHTERHLEILPETITKRVYNFPHTYWRINAAKEVKIALDSVNSRFICQIESHAR